MGNAQLSPFEMKLTQFQLTPFKKEESNLTKCKLFFYFPSLFPFLASFGIRIFLDGGSERVWEREKEGDV